MFTFADENGLGGTATPDRASLRRTPIFATLSDPELDHVRALLDRRSFHAGETIFRTGDPGDSCYIIQSGTAQIFHGDGEGPAARVLAELGSSAVLGEGCLLTDQARSATAKAFTDVTALRLSRSDFDTMLEEDHLAAYRMVIAMAAEVHRRLITSNNLLSELLRTAGHNGASPARELDGLRQKLLQEWSLY